MKLGYFDIFLKAGAVISPPTRRPLPGRPHGHTRGRREGACDHLQELRRKDGRPQERGLSREPGDRCGDCHKGEDSPPGRGIEEGGPFGRGLDLTGGMRKVAKEKAKGYGVKIGFVRADASMLPFAEGSFERVVASMGLHETGPGAVTEILSEAKRVLQPGGGLAIMDFHRAEGMAGKAQSLFFTFFEGETARDWVGTDIQSLLSGLGFKACGGWVLSG